MKKTSTFTLVRKSNTSRSSSSKISETSLNPDTSVAKSVKTQKSTKYALDEFKRLGDRAVLKAVDNKKLRDVYSKLDENFKATLRSTFGSSSEDLFGELSPHVAQSVKRITEELARSDKVLRVGIIDLGAWVTALPTLVERLNESQSMFTLFEILAPIPGGLVKTTEGFKKWLAEQPGEPIAEMAAEDASAPQMIFDDFHVVAKDIRIGMGLDMLIAFTPYMVAGTQDGHPFWNHFTATEGGCILISVTDLREYADQAVRPFEAAVGVLLVSSLFVTIIEDLDFHDVDTGCIFDYNQRRESLVDTIKEMMIDKECFAKMDLLQMQAAKSMLSVLKRMKRRGAK